MTEEYAIHNRMNRAVTELVEDLDGWRTLPIEWGKVTGLPTVGVTDESPDSGTEEEPVHRITIRAGRDLRYEVSGVSGRIVDGEFEPIYHIAWLSFEDKEYHDPPLSGLDAAVDYGRMVCNSAMIREEFEC